MKKILASKHFYFVGIGGIGMSGLAKILKKMGKDVSGSDITGSNITKELEKIGTRIYIGHNASNIGDPDAVVISSAIKNNPEVEEAKKRKIPVVKRSELLGFLMDEKKGIAVAGTHGKTTTATLISLILEEAGLDPTIAIGGEVKNIGGNAKFGKGEYFVAETCEYERGLLDIRPYAAIITNIEEEHLDTYKDLNDIVATFKKFISQINNDGFAVVSGDDFNIPKILKDFNIETITYGIKDTSSMWQAREIRVEEGLTNFTAYKNNQKITEFSLKIPGSHNISNAMGAIALTSRLGVKIGVIKKALNNFSGVRRRFEIKGKNRGIIVIDDYGHHPTEIKATLNGLRSIYQDNSRKVWCVFQPHQHSRTRFLLQEFARSFDDADRVMIPDIYAVRDSEKDIKSVSGKDLANKINKIKKDKAVYLPTFEEIVAHLKNNVKNGDIVLTIGAGPVYKIGEILLKILK